MEHDKMLAELDAEHPALLHLAAPRLARLSIGMFPVLLIGAVLWSLLARVDVVSHGRGTIRPAGEALRIQARTAGKIAEIRCAEGDPVAAGSVLMRYDVGELMIKVEGLRAQRARTQEALDTLEARQHSIVSYGQKVTEKDLLAVRTASIDLQANQEALEKELADAETERKRAANELEAARKRMESTRSLYSANLISRWDLDEAELKLNNAALAYEAALRRERERSHRVELARVKLAMEEKSAQASRADQARRLNEIRTEITATRKTLDQLSQDIALTEHLLQDAEVRAPSTGMISSLAIRHPGEVVSPGAPLCSMVPADSRLIVEVLIPDKESGLVRPGQLARVKFDAYPYVEYGVAEGRVHRIAPDSEVIDGTTAYRAWINLDEKQLKGYNRRGAALKIGMTAQAEIVTDKKRVSTLVAESLRGAVR